MHSLLEKAIEIRRKIVNEDPFFFDDYEDELKSIPAEEKSKIITQLDDVVIKNRKILSADQFLFKPIHNDKLIPAAVNIAATALLLILSSIFFISFNIDQNNIINISDNDRLAESRIIEVLREDSEAELKKKEDEISDIQLKLSSLKNDHNLIRLESEREISRIKDEYNKSIMDEIEKEKIRLAAAGLSDAVIANRINDMENRLETEYQVKVNALIEEYENDQNLKQADLNNTITLYESMIKTAKFDAQNLEQRIKVFETENIQNEDNRSITEDKYEKLKKEQLRKKIITDQINAGYSETGKLLIAGQFQGAGLKIENLENYLNKPEIKTLSFVNERRGMDFLLLGSLKQLIQAKSIEESTASNDSVSEIENLLAEGNSYFRNNDLVNADKIYKNAYSRIQELDESVQNTVFIENQGKYEKLETLFTDVKIENERLKYLDNTEKTRDGLKRNLKKFREGITVSDEQNKIRRATLVPLLQTKLNVRRILTTNDAVNDDPQLFAKLEEYIRAYGRERENEGVEKGFNEVNAIIRSLINSNVSVYYQIDENEELEFFFLMDGLEKLIGY